VVVRQALDIVRSANQYPVQAILRVVGLNFSPSLADSMYKVISLRKYLDSRPDQAGKALLCMIRLLLETIEAHAVKAEAADHEEFRAGIRGVQESLGESTPPAEILVLAGRTVKTIEEYNSRATKFVQRQCVELQAMIAMLTKTMTEVASGSQRSVLRLHEIERELQSASLIEDFQTVKIRMAECLEGLRGEIGRQHEESTHRVIELRSVLDASHARTAARANQEARVDPLTGLPERPAAEAALAAAAKSEQPAFAVLFVVERLDLINARFGHQVGDQVLLFFKEHVEQALAGSDRLFRWTGPALLAIIERDEPIAKIREEMNRVVSKRLSKSVSVANRSVLLPIPSNWVVFAIHEVRPHQQLLRNIDAFVGGDAESRPALAV
jgi:diguanylate cyclase (GGDEF)-like protein